MIRRAGELRIPFTTGILIGIGETAARARRGAARDARAARGARPHPRGHRPELPRQARHPDGRRRRARAGRADERLRDRPPGDGPADEHPGPAEPVGRLRAAAADAASTTGAASPPSPRTSSTPRRPGRASAASASSATRPATRCASGSRSTPSTWPTTTSSTRAARARARAGRRRRARPARRARAGRGGGRVSVTFCRTVAAGAPAGRARVREGRRLDDAAVAAALAGGAAAGRDRRRRRARRSPGSSTRRWRWSCSRAASPAGGSRCATADRAPTSSTPSSAPAPRSFAPTRARLEEAIELGWPARGRDPASRSRSPPSPRPSTRSPPGRLTWWSSDWDPDAVAALRDALAAARAGRAHRPPARTRDRRRPRATSPGPLLTAWLDQVDGSGAARPRYSWAPGRDEAAPGAGAAPVGRVGRRGLARGARPRRASAAARPRPRRDPRALAGRAPPPRVAEIERLFRARGQEVEAIARVADRSARAALRRHRHLRGQPQHQLHQPVLLPLRLLRLLARAQEPQPARRPVHPATCTRSSHRSVEAWERGATEVCLQGGIHPDFTGDFYVSVLEGIKERLPEMHVHGFTPLEVWQGAHTLGVSVREFLTRLRDAGLGTLPGHRRRDPRRPRARPPVPGQGAHRPSGPR